MRRKGSSVLFASLLLIGQLILGALSAGAASHDAVQHCDGCPAGQPSGMSHEMSERSGDGHCGAHCAHSGAMGAGHARCGPGCTMLGSGHCGSPASPAMNGYRMLEPVALAPHFSHDVGAVDLPESPLFDFLRPPARR